MDFSTIPPELFSQMPMVAVLLWIGIQARKELLASLERLSERVGSVQMEVRGLRLDLVREVMHEADDDDVTPGSNGATHP